MTTDKKKTGVQFEGKEAYVQEVFREIAPVYDKANIILSLGQVQKWQRFLVARTGIQPGGSVLDVGCGTGEITLLLAAAAGEKGRVIGLDRSPAMLAMAKEKRPHQPLPLFMEGDGLALPFLDDSFDVVTSGFTLRNVTDIPLFLLEMARVVRPGGKIVCLEAAQPQNFLLRWGFRLYFGRIVPLLGHFFDKGKEIGGRQPAYTWLRDSIEDFPYGEEMAAVFRDVGLQNVCFYPLTFGVANIYEGSKG